MRLLLCTSSGEPGFGAGGEAAVARRQTVGRAGARTREREAVRQQFGLGDAECLRRQLPREGRCQRRSAGVAGADEQHHLGGGVQHFVGGQDALARHFEAASSPVHDRRRRAERRAAVVDQQVEVLAEVCCDRVGIGQRWSPGRMQRR
jgi:hypothetical protein